MLTINQFRQYRRLKARRLLLESERDNLILLGLELDDPEIKWRLAEVNKIRGKMKEVRDYLDRIDPYISTMLRLHYVEGRQWRYIAIRQGGGEYTG